MYYSAKKILLTTQQTTYRFGALGNSGLGSAEERGFPSGKGRKKPFSAESAIINAFWTTMPQVRILSLRPHTNNPNTFRIGEAFGFFVSIEYPNFNAKK